MNKCLLCYKRLFELKLGLTFANKETVLELNGCRIEAYPSNHIDAYRALDNPKFILLERFLQQQQEKKIDYSGIKKAVWHGHVQFRIE